MGHKTHPIGFRVGVTRGWESLWFVKHPKDYAAFVIQDNKIREIIRERYKESGGISRIKIERKDQEVMVTINTARPGVIIGRGGQRVDELKDELQKMTGQTIRLSIQEIRQPELDAIIVGQSIAEQLERRVAYRRAVRAALQRSMQVGALGIKIRVGGRLGGADIARADTQMLGRIPLHTLRADIDFAISEARTTYGVIGIKVWLYRGRARLTPEELIAANALPTSSPIASA